MEDLTSWVSRQAQNMGIDFSCLSSHTRDQIISTLMSGLENGFRSRMDSPYLRFAVRKGIAKTESNLASELKDSVNTSIDGCTNTICNIGNYSLQCTDGFCTYITSCKDGVCTHITACTENIASTSKSCDNWCVHSEINECTDSNGCFDMKCLNAIEVGTTGCTDTGNCIDASCGNQSNNSVVKCIDNGSVSGGCRDQACCNRSCEDKGLGLNACHDEVCANGQTCADIPSGGSCWDQGCINSGKPGVDSCTDGNCRDKPCVNYNQCYDNSSPPHCYDQTCSNPGCNDGSPSSCTDKKCPDNPICTNGGTCSVSSKADMTKE